MKDSGKNAPARKRIETEETALADLGASPRKPPCFEHQIELPFSSLTGDEFEVFCFLLLLKEKSPQEKVILYGKTKDLGRDIVRILEDGTQELIQCKCFSRDVGEMEIAKELEKLCKNEYLKLLPCNADRVVFYLASNLRPAANDLIDNRSIWMKKIPQLFKGKMDRGKRKALREYAQSWWPEISHKIGVEINERAEKFPELVERFFSIKKVVDVSEAKRLREAVDSFTNTMVLPEYQKAPAQLKHLREEAERRNPGIMISYYQTDAGHGYTISPKPGTAHMHLGTLQLPADKAHEILAQGREIHLKPGEYSWKSAPDLSVLGFHETEAGELFIKQCLPQREVPIRLYCQKGKTRIAEVAFCLMKAVRLGTEECEFSIFGDQLAGAITLKITLPTKAMNMSLKPDLPSKALPIALSWMKLNRALLRSSELIVESIEHGSLFTFQGMSQTMPSPKAFRRTELFLSCLKIVSDEFGLNIRAPKDYDATAYDNARFLAKAIRHGRVKNRLATGTMTVVTTKNQIAPHIPWNMNMQAQMMYEGEAHYTILDYKLPTIRQRVLLGRVWPVDGAEALAEQVRLAPEQSEFEIKLRVEGMIFEFPKWLKTPAGEAPHLASPSS
jgi:hypothetical protein